MCVIIYKPAGVKMPSIDTLVAAFRANPHGCGYASPSLNYRGLGFTQFLNALSFLNESEPCIIHFRYATHGSIKRTNCHPFKRGGISFAHNGVLDIMPVGDRTDSETAFLKYIYPAIKNYGWGSDRADGVVRSVLGGSKFAFMYRGEVKLYGDFIKQPDGCYYSNLRFRFYMHNSYNHAI